MAFRVFPPERWWQLLCEKHVIVYFRLPIESIARQTGEWHEPGHCVLVRGSVISMRRNRFGTTVVRIRVHAQCRLYTEPLLPKDEIVEIDFRRVLGIDHRGAMLRS